LNNKADQLSLWIGKYLVVYLRGDSSGRDDLIVSQHIRYAFFGSVEKVEPDSRPNLTNSELCRFTYTDLVRFLVYGVKWGER
jgi:hypothetical protein